MRRVGSTTGFHAGCSWRFVRATALCCRSGCPGSVSLADGLPSRASRQRVYAAITGSFAGCQAFTIGSGLADSTAGLAGDPEGFCRAMPRTMGRYKPVSRREHHCCFASCVVSSRIPLVWYCLSPPATSPSSVGCPGVEVLLQVLEFKGFSPGPAPVARTAFTPRIAPRTSLGFPALQGLTVSTLQRISPPLPSRSCRTARADAGASRFPSIETAIQFLPVIADLQAVISPSGFSSSCQGHCIQRASRRAHGFALEHGARCRLASAPP